MRNFRTGRDRSALPAMLPLALRRIARALASTTPPGPARTLAGGQATASTGQRPRQWFRQLPETGSAVTARPPRQRELQELLRPKAPDGQQQHDGHKVKRVQAQERDIFPVDEGAP